jgi:hypothetical protein
MRFNEFSAVSEVAMNPKAFGQSLEQANAKGVLMGFEFEVCVPRKQIKQTSGNDLDWIKEVPADWQLLGKYYGPHLLFDLLAPFNFNGKPVKTSTSLVKAYNEQVAQQMFIPLLDSLPSEIQNAVKTRWKQTIERDRRGRYDKNSTFDFMRVTKSFFENKENGDFKDLAEKVNRIETYANTSFFQDVFGTDDIAKLVQNPKLNFYKLKHEVFGYMPRGDSYDIYPVSYDYMGAASILEPLVAKTFQNVKVLKAYHGEEKTADQWYIEPDVSVRPNNPNDGAAEVVTPPLPAIEAVNALKKFYQIAKQAGAYTNSSTGIHINISIPNGLDVLKLAVFSGDQYVLQKWGRAANDFAQGVMSSIKQGITTNKTPLTVFDENGIAILQDIALNVSNNHKASISNNGKWISFRHAGGDYLSNLNDVIDSVGRFVRAMVIANDPNMYRKEYLTKLSNLVSGANNTTGITDMLSAKQSPIKVDAVLYYGTSYKSTSDNLLRRSLFFDKYNPNIVKAPNNVATSITSKEFDKISQVSSTVTKAGLEKFGKSVNAVLFNAKLPIWGGLKKDVLYPVVYGSNRKNKLGVQIFTTITLSPGTPEHTWYVNLIQQQKRANTQQSSSSAIKEFANDGFIKPPKPPKSKNNEPWGDDDRSKIIQTVKQLLASGNRVDWKVPGQMGHVVHVEDDGVSMKPWGRPRSKKTYFLSMPNDTRDDEYKIKMIAPKHYAVVSSDVR